MSRSVFRFIQVLFIGAIAFGVCTQSLVSAQATGTRSSANCHLVSGSAMVVVPAQQRFFDGELDANVGQGLDWPDTEIGVVTPLSGGGYYFFASNGSCHSNCDSTVLNVPKFGSLARIPGTLDSPLGTPEAPAVPQEFLLRTISGVPPNYNGSTQVTYIGGGPVYRVPAAEPGAGGLLLVYQGAYDTDEPSQGSFYSFLGVAKSVDDGSTWTDLGVMIQSTARPTHNFSVDVGDGDLVDSGSADPTGRYFYIFFPDLCTYSSGGVCGGKYYSFAVDKGMAVARVDYEKFLTAAFSDAGTTPPLPEFKKFYDKDVTPWLAPTGNFAALHQAKYWQEPGMGGQSTDVWNPSSPYAGDMNVKSNSFLNEFVAIFNDGVNVGYAFSPDGLDWTPVVNLVTSSGSPAPNLGSATLIGDGDDPNVLGSTFYGYYMAYPTNGTGWNEDTLNRVTLECSAGKP